MQRQIIAVAASAVGRETYYAVNDVALMAYEDVASLA